MDDCAWIFDDILIMSDEDCNWQFRDLLLHEGSKLSPLGPDSSVQDEVKDTLFRIGVEVIANRPTMYPFHYLFFKCGSSYWKWDGISRISLAGSLDGCLKVIAEDEDRARSQGIW